MKESEIVEYIGSIEDKFPVNEWKLYGRHIWPYIKMSLCNSLKDVGESRERKEMDSYKGRSKLMHLKDAFLIPQKTTRQSADILIFHHNNARSIILDDGRTFDVNLDPFTLLLEKEYKIESLEYMSGCDHFNTFRPSYIVDGGLERVLLRSRIISKVRNNKIFINEQLPYYDEFINTLDEKIRAKFKKTNLCTQISYINLLSEYFAKIIKDKHIKFVIAGCGYGTDTAALFMACYDLKIKCMEVQHGIAGGSGHRWYTLWKRNPENGRRYEMLPDIYWCWGLADKVAIDSWGGDNHIAIFGHKPIHLVMDEVEELTKKTPFSVKNSKPNVLFSLQPEVNYPDWIVETIKETSIEYNWVIRRHPRNDECQEKMLHKIRSIPSVYIDGIDSIMLEKVIMHSDAHITNHSAVALDALEFGVKTIIIGSEYEDVFRSEIENEEMFLGLNKPQTILLLHKIIENKNNQKEIRATKGEAITYLRKMIGERGLFIQKT